MSTTVFGRRAAAAITLVAFCGVADPVAAWSRRHRPDLMRAPTADTGIPIPYARRFYPDEIEGGISGNLPFNNQIRKFKDPLNANGGK